MPSILECNRIVGSVYPYSLNFVILFASHLSSILALFFSKSLVKLLLHDGWSSILTQVLFFISSFIAINVHVARNPLQIDLHLVILLPQFFYSRSCLTGIVLATIITYSDRNNERKDIITFNQKCEAFLTSLFHPPPASEPLNWSNYIEKEWEWPEISTDEIKEAISNFGKKAPELDQISFFIIQKAYNSIPEYFHHV